jgi:hypothetical protein
MSSKAQVEGSGTVETPDIGLKTIEYALASGNVGSMTTFGSNVAEYWPEPPPAEPVTDLLLKSRDVGDASVGHRLPAIV